MYISHNHRIEEENFRQEIEGSWKTYPDNKAISATFCSFPKLFWVTFSSSLWYLVLQARVMCSVLIPLPVLIIFPHCCPWCMIFMTGTSSFEATCSRPRWIKAFYQKSSLNCIQFVFSYWLCLCRSTICSAFVLLLWLYLSDQLTNFSLCSDQIWCSLGPIMRRNMEWIPTEKSARKD